jgi:hypothetical protein
MPIGRSSLLLLVTLLPACGGRPAQNGTLSYAEFSDNPLPVSRGERVVWDRGLPALQVAYWSRASRAVVASTLQARLGDQGWRVAAREFRADLLVRSPREQPERYALNRTVLTGNHRGQSSSEPWSELVLTIIDVQPLFGCGTLVSVHRLDHWVGWAREFHGVLLPWRSPRTARVVTNIETELVRQALVHLEARGPLVGGGPIEPLENEGFRAEVQKVVPAGCRTGE